MRSTALQPSFLSLVLGVTALSIIGQKTVGYATREVANVEIEFEAAKVRRKVLSVDSLVEKGQVAVFTDSGSFIIPRSALQVDPPVKKLSMKRQNGHFGISARNDSKHYVHYCSRLAKCWRRQRCVTLHQRNQCTARSQEQSWIRAPWQQDAGNSCERLRSNRRSSGYRTIFPRLERKVSGANGLMTTPPVELR